MKENPILINVDNIEDDNDIYDICTDYAYELMGGSEFYDFRVCEKVNIYHSPEDIFLERTEIHF